MKPDVIQHADEVVAHRVGEAGRFLGSALAVGGAIAQLLTCFIQRPAGLLQARRYPA
jgi:hypothetical protein